MRNKLRDDRGETLIEVLASILICTLSVSLLFGAIMTSSGIDSRTQALDEQYYQDLTRAERQWAGAGTDPGDVYTAPAAVTVTVKSGEGNVRDVTSKVNFYGSDRLLSYAYTFPEESAP